MKRKEHIFEPFSIYFCYFLGKMLNLSFDAMKVFVGCFSKAYLCDRG
jgi:hypothetical protein